MLFVGAVLLAIFVLAPPWSFVVVGVAAVVEVAETFFWLWLSRRGRARYGAETLVGAHAVVVAPCLPAGQVRLEGELWQARCEAGAEPGDPVRVIGRDGLTLLVARE